MKRRNVAAVILLSIVTCGIYYLYWFVVTTNEVEAALGSKSDGACKSGGVALLLAIVTCGIYPLYWWYKMGGRVSHLGDIHSVKVSDNGLGLLLLHLFGLSIVSVAILQVDINKICDANGGVI